MPRTCTICTHPDRELIDSALLSGEAFRKIAKRSGTSITALFRHKTNDLGRVTEGSGSRRDSLRRRSFGQIKDLTARVLRILEKAEADGDARTALVAVREARGNVELLCKMTIAAEAAQR